MIQGKSSSSVLNQMKPEKQTLLMKAPEWKHQANMTIKLLFSCIIYALLTQNSQLI